SGTLDALAEARELLRERQRIDLHAISVQSADFGLCLSRSGWQMLPAARRAGALRSWLALHGARMPSRARLDAIVEQLASPRDDASPVIRHEGRELRRYRDLIVCVP